MQTGATASDDSTAAEQIATLCCPPVLLRFLFGWLLKRVDGWLRNGKAAKGNRASELVGDIPIILAFEERQHCATLRLFQQNIVDSYNPRSVFERNPLPTKLGETSNE